MQIMTAFVGGNYDGKHSWHLTDGLVCITPTENDCKRWRVKGPRSDIGVNHSLLLISTSFLDDNILCTFANVSIVCPKMWSCFRYSSNSLKVGMGNEVNFGYLNTRTNIENTPVVALEESICGQVLPFPTSVADCGLSLCSVNCLLTAWPTEQGKTVKKSFSHTYLDSKHCVRFWNFVLLR